MQATTTNASNTATALQGITDKAYSVGSLNELIRSRLQGDPKFSSIWLEGEVSNYKQQPTSGHIYFSLKDSASQINCTFFRHSNSQYRQLNIQDGSQILVFGSVTVYPPRGNYQFNVRRVLLAGEGELRRKIEALQRKLEQEGLFASDRKRELPFLPLTLGIATAASGAAVQDIMQSAWARYPDLHIILAPCIVQGVEAPSSICLALQLLQKPELAIDVIIVGRGGGSFEDLLAFSEERVARAITDCSIPIVSAVGHEIDRSLSDLAADRYAATPTAASEMVTPIIAEIWERIQDSELRMQVRLEQQYKESQARLSQYCNSIVYHEPLSILEAYWQSLDDLKKRLQQASLMLQQRAWRQYERFAYLPSLLYEKNLARHRQHYQLLNERLHNFSPLATLKRGYAVVRDKRKQIIHRAQDAKAGDELEVLLAQGHLAVRVEKTQNNTPPVKTRP